MKTIFCPIDFKDQSNLAAQWASMIAIERNWKLVLFNKFLIFPQDVLINDPDSRSPLDYARKEAEKKLLQVKYDLCKKYKAENFNCNITTNYGIDTDEVIVKAAQEVNAQMIVMGTEGAQRFGDILWGSNTTHVINQTNIPVLVVPKEAVEFLPKTFVYASDLLNEDESNINFVLDFAKDLNSKIIFLHINENKEPNDLGKLKEVISDHITHFPKIGKTKNISFEVIKSDNLYAALQGYAHNKSADLIVLGQHKRNFFEKLLKGDFTRLMALYSYIPLLILHKKV